MQGIVQSEIDLGLGGIKIERGRRIAATADKKAE
jgi:hypothetical protein